MAYTVGVAAMLVAFWATPASMAWAQWVSVFMIGFFLYGPQMLIGLCGAELVGPESVGASEVRNSMHHSLRWGSAFYRCPLAQAIYLLQPTISRAQSSDRRLWCKKSA